MKKIIGYTVSDGYCLCPLHADYGKLADSNNETGYVVPIYEGDTFDSVPYCDVCPLGSNAINGVQLVNEYGEHITAVQPFVYHVHELKEFKQGDSLF